MRRSRAPWSLLLLGLLAAGVARAESPQEKKRKDILDELGLKKKHPAPPPAGDVGPAPSEPPAESGEKAGAPGGSRAKQKGAARSTAPAAPSFGRVIHPLLMSTCKLCHSPGARRGRDALAALRRRRRRSPRHRPLREHPRSRSEHAAGQGLRGHGSRRRRPLATGRHAVPAGARLDPRWRTSRRDHAGRARRHSRSRRAPRRRRRAVRRRPPRPLPPPIAATPAPEEAVPAAPPASAAATPPAAPVIAAPATRPSAPSFAATVQPVLMSACALCHRAGAPRRDDPAGALGRCRRATKPIVRQLVDPQAPEQSLLVGKATGQMHGGGAVLSARRSAARRDLGLGEGARPPRKRPCRPAPRRPAAAPLPPAPAPAAVTGGHAGAAPGPGGPGGPGGAGLALPLGFMLNGRFSLDYERRQFSGDPFESPSVNALRSYHHFLFLSRDAAGDPCGLSVEVLTLQFWEAHCRVPGLPASAPADGGGRQDRRALRRRPALSPELRRPGRVRPAGAAGDLGGRGARRPPAGRAARVRASPTISSSCAATRCRTPTRSSICRAASRPTTPPSLGGGTAWAPPGCSCRPGTRPTTTRSGSGGDCSCRPST